MFWVRYTFLMYTYRSTILGPYKYKSLTLILRLCIEQQVEKRENLETCRDGDKYTVGCAAFCKLSGIVTLQEAIRHRRCLLS